MDLFKISIIIFIIWCDSEKVTCDDQYDQSEVKEKVKVSIPHFESNEKSSYSDWSDEFRFKIAPKDTKSNSVNFHPDHLKSKSNKEVNKVNKATDNEKSAIKDLKYFNHILWNMAGNEVPVLSEPDVTKKAKPAMREDKWPKLREQKISEHSKRCKPGQRCEDDAKWAPVTLMQQEPEATAASTLQDKPVSKPDGTPDVLPPFNMLNFLNKIEPTFENANISIEVLGKTASYNDIVLLKVSACKTSSFRVDESKFADEMPEKKIIFIVHGLSAGGIKTIPCLQQTEHFLTLLKYYFCHLDKFDIYIIPMANPDGVIVPSAIWNKNSSPQEACSGVALDRNFEVAWDGNSTIDPCSQQYPGPRPFSEAETRIIKEVFHRNSHKIIAYMHVHSSSYNPDIYKGDAVLYPRGFSESMSDDDRYIDLKGEIDEAMKNASFQLVAVSTETLYSWYGKVHGTSVDYASSIYGIPYALELCMQSYVDNEGNVEKDMYESYVSLTEVWKRVIDAIFNNIHRAITSGPPESRRFLNRNFTK